jgi:hypothetical protein
MQVHSLVQKVRDSGRMIVARQFTAGREFPKDCESVKRTAEFLTQ